MNAKSYIEAFDVLAKESLSSYRYQHSLNVAQTAKELALHYHYCDPDLAYLCGLGHDIAKEIPIESQIILAKYIGRYREIDQDFPMVLHGRIAAYILKESLEFSSFLLDQACSLHTTGRIGMTDLDYILYIADYIEPGRPYAKDLELDFSQFTLESLAQNVLHRSCNYLISAGKALHPDTQEWLESLEKQNSGHT